VAGDSSLAEALSLAEVHYAKALSDLGIVAWLSAKT